MHLLYLDNQRYFLKPNDLFQVLPSLKLFVSFIMRMSISVVFKDTIQHRKVFQ